MLFTLNNELLAVKFSRNGTRTRAELCRFDNDAGILIQTNIVGESFPHKGDRFTKSKGRKYALRNLFKRMNELSAGYDELEYPVSKEDRTKIWEIYFQSHRM